MYQRGEPAIFDKYTRARMALCGGADLIVELPAVFATASAEDFASCGVALLDSLGTDLLCFGSESGNLHTPAESRRHSGQGIPGMAGPAVGIPSKETYPSARSLAVADLKNPKLSTARFAQQHPRGRIPQSVKKAEKFHGSGYHPEKGAGYHDTECSGPYASASAIRLLLKQPEALREELCKQIPPAASTRCRKRALLPLQCSPDDLTELFQFRLLPPSMSRRTSAALRIFRPNLPQGSPGRSCSLLPSANRSCS